MKVKSDPTIKKAVEIAFGTLPDYFRGIFGNKYKKRINANIIRLQGEWWDNHEKMHKLKKTLNPKEYIPIQIKNDQIQKQIDLLKSLIDD